MRQSNQQPKREIFLKLVFAIAVSMFGLDYAFATAAPSYKGREISCEVNMAFGKDDSIKEKWKLPVDLRIVSLPVLKLSGKKINLVFGGSSLHCRYEYYAEVDDKYLATACSDHERGGALNIKELYFQELKATADDESIGGIAEGGRRKFFCVPTKTKTTDSKPNETQKTHGAQ